MRWGFYAGKYSYARKYKSTPKAGAIVIVQCWISDYDECKTIDYMYKHNQAFSVEKGYCNIS